MESTLITGLPLLVSPSKSRPVSPLAFAGARRLASVSFSSSSGCGVLCSRGGEYAGVGSSVSAAAAALGEAAEPGSEAILLSVQGMMCDGCAASVKKILESQPEVSSATVDFKEAKAVVWTTPEVKVTVDWQKQCGEKLANHLGACGFESRLQGKPHIPGVGATCVPNRTTCSRNSTVELLYGGVGGAELGKLEQSSPKQALYPCYVLPARHVATVDAFAIRPYFEGYMLVPKKQNWRDISARSRFPWAYYYVRLACFTELNCACALGGDGK